jgi:sterol desaturase/sphingolipid hydroxylase (fatty acid hydroxylase superfamily)
MRCACAGAIDREKLAISYAVFAVPTAFALLFALERAFPLRVAKRALPARLRVNLVLGLLALATAAVLVRPAATAVMDGASHNGFGLLALVPLPPLAEAVVAFLLLDLTFYYWHRANHRWSFLWRFHNVHHVDPDLDVSTAYRFHFAEIGFSAAFRAVQVALIGGAPWMFVVYELAFQLNTLFQHSNARLPVGVERWLCLLLVTPRMHGIHHSQLRAETDSNWSSVLSCWDRLHGTLRLDVPQAAIEIGVPGYARPEDNRWPALLAMPFRPQRDYWGARDVTRARDPARGRTADTRRLAA